MRRVLLKIVAALLILVGARVWWTTAPLGARLARPSPFSKPPVVTTARADLPVSEDLRVDRVRVVSSVNDGVISDVPKTPTVADDVRLYLVIEGRLRGAKIYFVQTQSVVLEGRSIDSDSNWERATDARPVVHWYKVEPIERNLSNTEGGWHWERVKYTETRFADERWIVPVSVDPTIFEPQKRRGTMRFKVSVTVRGRTLSSPGAESCGISGIAGAVHRISVRGCTGIPIVDWGYAFMNQPYIWGSASPTRRDEDHQAENFIGADCADFVVAAARRAGHRISYGSTFDLPPSHGDTEFVSRSPQRGAGGVYVEAGIPVEIAQDAVHLGDLVLFERHVGILTTDNPPFGVLSENDLILHTLFREPIEEPIAQAFAPPFSVVRFVR